MAIYHQVFSNTIDVTATQLVMTLPETLAAGTVIVLATTRSTGTPSTNGVASITGIGGASWVLHPASACRASTHDLSIHYIKLNSQVSAGATFTITHTSSQNRLVAIARPVTGVDVPHEQDTGDNATGTTGNIASDVNGSGTTATITGAQLGTLVDPDQVIFGAFAAGSMTVTGSAGTNYTLDAFVSTQNGTSDRALLLEHREVSAAGSYDVTATYTATQGWAGVAISLPLVNTVVNPNVNAGADQANLEPGVTVTLDSSASTVGGGTFTSRQWTQTGGSPTVTMTNANTAVATFEAPYTIAGTTLTFTHTATNSTGGTDNDSMTVTMLPCTERAIVGGVQVPVKLRTIP